MYPRQRYTILVLVEPKEVVNSGLRMSSLDVKLGAPVTQCTGTSGPYVVGVYIYLVDAGCGQTLRFLRRINDARQTERER